MPRNCVERAENFCYICGEVTFARQSEKGVSFVFRMQDQRPRQILGNAHMLPEMCNKSFAVAEWQKTCDAVRCSYGLEGAKQSHN